MGGMDSEQDVRRVRELVAGAQRIVVLSGAGISTDSGIPDFRGPNGVWTKNPAAEKLSTLSDYVADPEVRQQSWQARLEHPGWQARPNAAHRALVELEHSGRMRSLITQNIDGLHQKAGSAAEAVIELHGTMFDTECLSCGDRRDMAEALQRVSDGDADPACELCGGILKSATISFGQALDMTVIERARQDALTCDLMLVVGSSLTVHPAAGLVGVAADADAPVVICNAEETPYDPVATTILRTPLVDTLPTLV